jgi:integrative and conjugative element protein (TIGR02256 family)
VTDEGALHKLYDARRNKLPKETGGVLLGSIDLDRRIIYVVDTVLSPPDSEEWPTMYIRGCRGLLDEVKRMGDATLGNLEYVGEWHSHPAGFSTKPSRADMQVFAWIADHMDREGLPGVMMIVGDDRSTSCFVGQMTHEESLLPPHLQ